MRAMTIAIAVLFASAGFLAVAPAAEARPCLVGWGCTIDPPTICLPGQYCCGGPASPCPPPPE